MLSEKIKEFAKARARMDQEESGKENGQGEEFDAAAMILALVLLYRDDRLEYCRQKLKAAQMFGISPYDLEQIVVEELRKQEAGNKESRTFKLVKAGQIKATAPDWLIHDLLPADCIGLSFGDSGAGKSFIAVDFALCVATGTPYHGKRVKQGPVVYIAGEGQRGLAMRFGAWSVHNGIDYHDAPFYVSQIPAAFLEPESLKQVEAAIAEIKPVFIVIDTLARNFGPGDENSTSDMSSFVDAIDYIRRPHNATLMVVHHTGHSEKGRSRGSYSLKCALDVEYEVKRDSSNVVVLYPKKMKDAEESLPMAFEPHVIKMIDDDGKPMSSLAFKLTEMPVNGTAQKSLPPSQRIALEALTRLLVDRKTVHIDEWRAECYAAGISDSQEGKKKAFMRARTALMNIGAVLTRDDNYWLGGQGGH